jgi:predicted AlkP superfamily pyrophosphatase or phosphodiesterase
MSSFRVAAWLALSLFTLPGQGAPEGAPPHKLIVLSVDGLDWRYLRDRDALHLRIPHLRRLLQDGRYADGVVGVWPTITWPSHTTLITGVRPDQHGIEGNRRPKSEGGDYYWNVDLLKAPTLWQRAHERGLKTAAVTWPVTVGASIDFNLPEYFLRRQGGSMDLEGIASKGTPHLAAEISKSFPSFPQQWVDDRTRTLAALFLLREKKPDLLLVHLVDLDSEEHDQGPFSENSYAILERTDELIGNLLEALPSGYDLALVSDHGFERVDKTANPRVLLARNNIAGKVQPMGGILTMSDPAAAAFLRQAAADPENGIGAEIPRSELLQYAPKLSDVAAAFQPAEHVMFGPADHGPYFTPPYEKGNHGFWPTRGDYRSVFVLWGPGVARGQLGEIQLISIAGQLAAVLGLPPLP